MGDRVYKNRCAPHISEWCIKKFPIALFFFLCARKRYTQIFIYSLPLHFFCTIIKTFLFHFFLLVCSFPLHFFFALKIVSFAEQNLALSSDRLRFSFTHCLHAFTLPSRNGFIVQIQVTFVIFFLPALLFDFYMLNSAVWMSERWMLKIERLMFESVKK